MIIVGKTSPNGNCECCFWVDDDDTHGDNYPLSNIAEMLNFLHSSVYFITFSLCSDFHQVLVSCGDRANSIQHSLYYEFHITSCSLCNTSVISRDLWIVG